MPRLARLLTLILLLTPLMSSAAHSQDRLTTQALERIEKYEKLEPDLEAGDVKTANLYLNQLGWAAKRLNASSEKGHKVWKDASDRYSKLVKKIQEKAQGDSPPPKPGTGYDHQKLVALNHAVGNAYNNLKMLNVSHLMDEARVKGIRKELADFETRIAKFPAEDDNVKLVTANIADFRKLFEAGMAQLNEGKDQMGAVSARLKEIRAKYETKNQPAELSFPFDEVQLRAWAAELRRWREVELPTDIAWLAEVAANPAAPRNDILSLHSWLTGSWTRTINGIEHGVRERVASEVWEGLELAKWVLETDVSDRNHVLGRILGKGRLDDTVARLREGLHGVEMARVFDDAVQYPAVMGPRPTEPGAQQPAFPDRKAQSTEIQKAIDHMYAAARQALDEVRLPKAASTDAELLKIAEATLRNPDYEVGTWERLVINVDKTRKERREAYIRGSGASATITYYEYVWDQFQVTTCEKVGDEYWLFANTLKLYHSGDPTSAVGRWILSQRFQTTPILPENVKK